MVSGGSLESWSVTCPARIVTDTVSSLEKSVSGSSVKVVGPPATVAVCGPLEPPEIENHEPVTSTGSENVIETLEPTATFVAPLAGTVELTCGAESPPQGTGVVAVFSGFTDPAAKSALLASVSVHPPPPRDTDVVLDGAGAGPAPS